MRVVVAVATLRIVEMVARNVQRGVTVDDKLLALIVVLMCFIR